MLDPRALATLGIGYGADLLVKIGLWPAGALPLHAEDYSAGGKRRSASGFRRPLAPVVPVVEEDEAFLLSVLL